MRRYKVSQVIDMLLDENYMKQVIINIDWMDHNFGAAPQNQDIACVATAKTLEAVENEIVEALKFHIEGMRSHGESIPEEFLGDWEPHFVLTTRAQLRYSDDFITFKALSKVTGINEQQLSHYANGRKIPRPATRKRIADGIRAISQRLLLIF